jgi:hypothetical protein
VVENPHKGLDVEFGHPVTDILLDEVECVPGDEMHPSVHILKLPSCVRKAHVDLSIAIEEVICLSRLDDVVDLLVDVVRLSERRRKAVESIPLSKVRLAIDVAG